jgi:hypothetical protein
MFKSDAMETLVTVCLVHGNPETAAVWDRLAPLLDRGPVVRLSPPGPTYYGALFPDLRKELTAAAKQARESGLGVWANDATTTGFDVTGLNVLQDDIVIVPKLSGVSSTTYIWGTAPWLASQRSWIRQAINSSSCRPAIRRPGWTPWSKLTATR